MKILIIGSNGFIGSHAFHYFSKHHETWGADVHPGQLSQNYFQLEPDLSNISLLFRIHYFDVCLNASGNGSVPISLENPLFDFELNVFNTAKILDAIRQFVPSCKFINLSSAAVYGTPASLPIYEHAEPSPMSPYGWHKLNGETLCRQYHALYNLHCINLRLFSVYGENLKKQIFWDIFQKSLLSRDIELFGTGRETRDFINIRDLISAIDIVLQKAVFDGSAINIASGISTSIETAATILCKELDPAIHVSFNAVTKKGDPLQWQANIDKMAALGFKPAVDIEEGLKKLAKWLKEKR